MKRPMTLFIILKFLLRHTNFCSGVITSHFLVGEAVTMGGWYIVHTMTIDNEIPDEVFDKGLNLFSTQQMK